MASNEDSPRPTNFNKEGDWMKIVLWDEKGYDLRSINC